jgi:hypothetical protein
MDLKAIPTEHNMPEALERASAVAGPVPRMSYEKKRGFTMTKLSFRPVLAVLLLSAVPLTFCGCSGTLEQEAQSVRVSPVSSQYKLSHKLEGKTYILLAETSTGQEQHRSAVSDSLARALKDNWKELDCEKKAIGLPFLDNKAEVGPIPSEGLQVMSFTDLANKLNEKGLCQRYADMMKFYEQNGMFRKSDLEFLAKEIGADYVVLPTLLDIRRWSQGRLSVFGVKFLNTQIVSGMLGLEIWETKTGHKVFSATSDVTLASERIKEEPMSMEEAFQKAWLGIMKQLPGQSPVKTTVEAEAPKSLEKSKHADSRSLTNAGATKAS